MAGLNNEINYIVDNEEKSTEKQEENKDVTWCEVSKNGVDEASIPNTI